MSAIPHGNNLHPRRILDGLSSTNELMHSLIARIVKNLFFYKHILYRILANKRFYCNALSGLSDYNICINSDMTVSCNCGDDDGTGHIGDLADHSLEEIFDGPIAMGFREKLSAGKIPIMHCVACKELRYIDKSQKDIYKINYTLPHKGIMIENTVNCNLSCGACKRNQILKIRKSKRLSLPEIEKISLLINKHNIKIISYFNLGEPFLYDTIFDELSIIRKNNPDVDIRVSTNGLLLDNDKKREAVMLLDHINFSIDGISQEMTSKYQRGYNFNKAYTNLVNLTNYRKETKPTIEWRYILFNWNDKETYIKKAIRLAKEANVDMISFHPTFRPSYGLSYRYLLGLCFKGVRFRWSPYIIDLRKPCFHK